ncbi:MAG: DUF1343 domain-containing protein [Desulfobacterales bacterium]|nr:DUF1343 domain-containing protein [Desulfobacterales bacterium]
MAAIRTGLEILINSPPDWIYEKKLGLLCNPASIDIKFEHARYLIYKAFKNQLKALFSPQHGFFSSKQDNMVESEDIIDLSLNIPVYSLYGKTRIPTKKMFDNIDILIIDLQDVGTRVYTYIYTMSFCMEAAKRFDKKIVILDRPNPISGSIVEGNLLTKECESFVGRFSIPMRHGLTIGEIALLFNDCFNIGCNIEIIKMENWKRDMFFNDTNLPWVPPSPNLPTFESALVYPGQVLWEGTNISEGRGTAQPFEIFGAPFLDIEKILDFMGGNKLPGAILRPIGFEPTSNKWTGQFCKGFQIHVISPKDYQPYATSLKLLQAIINIHKDEFEWKLPPYEYELSKLPIDLIIGDPAIRNKVEKLDKIENIVDSWTDQLNYFVEVAKKYYLY